MSKINIGLVVRNEKPFFEITGPFDEALKNRRLQGFLSRVRCISEKSSLLIPFREEEKVPRFRDIQKKSRNKSIPK